MSPSAGFSVEVVRIPWSSKTFFLCREGWSKEWKICASVGCTRLPASMQSLKISTQFLQFLSNVDGLLSFIKHPESQSLDGSPKRKSQGGKSLFSDAV